MKGPFLLLSCVICGLFSSLAVGADGITTIRTFNSGNPDAGEPLFRQVPPSESGIDFTNPIDNSHPLSRLYISGFASSGVAIGDVDGDGLPDVYVTRGPGANGLYRNLGGFKFEDVTAKAGVGLADVWSAGATFADVNGDGHQDLHVCVYGAANRLFMNDGSGVFKDEAGKAGVAVADASLMAHFQDYDQDGDLDFYLLTNRLYREGGLPTGKATKVVNGKPEMLPEYAPYYRLEKTGQNQFVMKTVGRPDLLFQNDGKGGFKEVSQSAGISGSHYGLSATWLDYDHDGLVDLYVANDFKDPDRLYRNMGNGQFKDVIREVVPHTPWYSMGSDASDMNNDGLLDLLVLDMSSTSHYKEKVNMGDMSVHMTFMDTAEPRQLMRNAFFVNSGTGRFLESAHMSGLASTDWSWAVKLSDFDSDGWTDVFVTNGMTAELTNADLGMDQSKYIGREEWSYLKDQPRRTEPNLAYRNKNGVHFESVGKEWGLDHVGMSYASASGDLNRDGHLDLIVAHLNEPIGIYR
ncbi:MAG: VCBS repeat-containing protein, partial [Verrucomicrobiota bacterium]